MHAEAILLPASKSAVAPPSHLFSVDGPSGRPGRSPTEQDQRGRQWSCRNCYGAGSMPQVYLSDLFSIGRKRIPTRKEVQQCNETLPFRHRTGDQSSRSLARANKLLLARPSGSRVAVEGSVSQRSRPRPAGAASRRIPGVEAAKGTARPCREAIHMFWAPFAGNQSIGLWRL